MTPIKHIFTPTKSTLKASLRTNVFPRTRTKFFSHRTTHTSPPSTPPRRIQPLALHLQSRPTHAIAPFHTNSTSKMSSDADYASFLDKANQSTGDASTTAKQDSKKYSTKSVNTAVPKALEEVEEYFVSDADEPFEPVALSWKKGKEEVGADDLKSLLSHDSDVESASEKQFSQYKKVIDAVKKAGNGKVSFFRVEHSGTRAEYYVVSVDEKEGRVVGLKALAVES